LEGQKLWVFIEPVPIRPDIRRHQQARFIVKNEACAR
jgi:hypothetical protein